METFISQRRRFIETLKGGVAVICAYDEMQLSADMEADFLQEASFWWLTGIEQPGWKLIVEPDRSGRATLVRPTLSASQIAFNGSLSDIEAMNISGANAVIEEKDFESYVRGLAKKHSLVATIIPDDTYHFVHNPAQAKLKKILDRTFNTVEDCSRRLFELRAIKTPEEIAALKKAIKLTTDAFAEVKELLSSLKYEYEIEAEFSYRFRKKGARHAYAPIVAAGPRSCTLHYNNNSQKFTKSDAIVIDIGARVAGYPADITRTYCINPSKRLIAVHAAVESAQKKIISKLKPGLSLSELQDDVLRVMHAAMVELGLLAADEPLEHIQRYMPHSIGHGLGVDVHDRLGHAVLKENMVMTVEPGIYIPEEGIGVRIEDDILITANGHQNLSARLSTKL